MVELHVHRPPSDLGVKGFVKVTILGSPNVGKSSLFNSVVRGHVEVANWPGTTVEINVGRVTFNGLNLVLFDLPGIYGLTGSTILGHVVESFLLKENPDVALILIDSINLERSLNLALQIMELHGNVVIALTKLDIAHGRSIHINVEGLSRSLNTTIVPTSIVWGVGVREVLEAVVKALESKGGRLLRVDYGILEPYIEELSEELAKLGLATPNPRWVSIKLIEGDVMVEDMVKNMGYMDVVDKARRLREEVLRTFGRDPAALIAEARFNLAVNLVRQYVVRAPTRRLRVEKARLSRFDMLFVDPRTAPIVSLTLVSLVFLAVFTINTGFPFNVVLEYAGFGDLASLVESASLANIMRVTLDAIAELIRSILGGAPSWFTGFIVEGVIGGVGVVLLLVPLILVAAALVAILEDSGLLPRIAVGTHRPLCRAGFSGHAILPITMCLGCNVAGIMTARSIPGHWEKLKFYMLASLIPCQARLVVFVVLASIIGGLLGFLTLVSIYILSLTLLAVLSMLIDKLGRPGVKPELLLEIPEIHKPIRKVVWWISWSRVKHYIVKAGTIIFMGSVLMWVLSHITPSISYTENPEDSIAGILSKTVAPIFKPMGVENWEVVFALIIGFIAKELFLSAIVIATGNPDPLEALATLGLDNKTLAAVAVFIALYTPCLATIATIKTESRSTRIALIALVLALTTAYIAASTTILALNLIFKLH